MYSYHVARYEHQLCAFPFESVLSRLSQGGFDCRATFDVDNIDIGPERRAYLEQKLERVWEQNSQVGLLPLQEHVKSGIRYITRS